MSSTGQKLLLLQKKLARGCLWQPLYCLQIDIFVWLHVTDIYSASYIYVLYSMVSAQPGQTFFSNRYYGLKVNFPDRRHLHSVSAH